MKELKPLTETEFLKAQIQQLRELIANLRREFDLLKQERESPPAE